MENASKALIIAGAILLAILIISLGIMIFNQASGVVNNNAMSEVEIASFNQKFTQYEGTKVKGSQVNALLNQIIQNNVTYNDEDKSKQIKLDQQGSDWQSTTGLSTGDNIPLTTPPKALTGKVYDVKCSSDEKTGLVNKITIKGN